MLDTKILVIDDDKNIRFLMREVLENAKYTVFTAVNGEDALSVMENNHIDLAIVDIMMPKMDGYEFTKTLRITNADLPVLMVSAKQMPEDRKKGFLSGIDDYMSKPIDTEELLLHVKALLRRAKETKCSTAVPVPPSREPRPAVKAMCSTLPITAVSAVPISSTTRSSAPIRNGAERL